MSSLSQKPFHYWKLFASIRNNSRKLFHKYFPVCCENGSQESRNEQESKEQWFIRPRQRYSSPETSIIFDKKKDSFGTLSSDRMMRRLVESGDEEDSEVTEINFIDGKEGKTRLKPINYAMMIKVHLKENRLAEALSVLENTMLQEHKAKPDVYIYNLLISGCAKHGYTKKAFQLFNQMKKRGLHPRLSTYTSLFNAYANGPWDGDSLARARHLRELMTEKGVQPNVINYNAMIKAFGRHGDLETSFSIMDEMIYKKMRIDSVTFNFLLQASINDKKAGFRHALLVWRKMLEMKILPTIFTFNLLLRSTRDCELGDTKAAQQLLESLNLSETKHLTEGAMTSDDGTKALQVQQPPNFLLPTPYSGSLISISSKLNKPWHRLVLLGSMEGMFSTMDACKVKPDIKTFSLLRDILPPTDEAEETLMNEMKKRGVKLDIDFCNMLIKKRNSSVRFSSALNVLNIIRENRLNPNIMTYGVLALGCNTPTSAIHLIKDINSSGFRLNVQILTVVIRRAMVSLDIDMVLIAINAALSENVIPDQKFYKNLTDFRDAVLFNLDSKSNHKNYAPVLDSKDFNKKFSKLLSLMDTIQKRVKDPSSVHPWDQFKVQAKAVR